jgi:C1A family cysteine protease
VGGANYVTPVKNQGNCGSCVAFGSVAALETTAAFTRRVPGMKLDLSEAHLFYTHGGSVGRTCANGWYPVPALTMSRDKGVTFEDYFPYTPGNNGGHTLNPDFPNRLAKPVDVRDVTGDPAAIKQQIVTYGSTTACFYVYADFFSYRSGVYKHVSGDLQGGHCVALVGYDDAQSCWIAKNSWGPEWGDNGYFRIGYGECGIETWQCAGTSGVNLRAWTGLTKVVGLWSNDAARNAFAYLDSTGWVRLTSDSDIATTSMLAECISAKGAGRQVNAFTDNGAVSDIYVY